MPTDDVAWSAAVSVHAHLLAGGRLRPFDPPIPALVPEQGEYAVAVIDGGMTFAQYYEQEVWTGGGGPTLIVGSPQFLTGYVLGSMVLRSRARRRARRQREAQWRPERMLRAVVTTRRVWCEIVTAAGPQWLNYNYDTIAALALDGDTLTLSFLHCPPLRLAGDWVPWCAAVVAHFRYGPAAAAAVPALNAAAWAS